MRLKERFLASVEKIKSGCWMWRGKRISFGKTGRPGHGILRVTRKWVYAHRFAYELFVDEIPKGMCVCHECDEPGCVNPKHLWLGTHAENIADAKRKGRTNRGEKNNQAKLTEADVREIVRLYETGEHSQVELGERFGVRHSVVSNIVRGKRWAHLGVKVGNLKGRGLSGDRNPSRRNPERLARGERHPRCKLTDEQVEQVRTLAGTMVQTKIAERFGISQAQIGRILRGESRGR